MADYLYAWVCTYKGEFRPVDWFRTIELFAEQSEEFGDAIFYNNYENVDSKDLIELFKKYIKENGAPTFCVALAEHVKAKRYDECVSVIKGVEEKYPEIF